MNENLTHIKLAIYDKCSFTISNYHEEAEGKEYEACQFDLDGKKIINRSAKITPKKVGQFVTFWRRDINGITTPFKENDSIDFFTVNVRKENHFGQFVFPKSVLIQKGILSTKNKDGKRGFRVYPKWDVTLNQQAKKTQSWQLKYFYEINSSTILEDVVRLFNEK
ncbi:MepB family protein [Flammeovirga agarivorans]|uniref:MepB family protein n=1 Tax=Flammeovirga agarivorans TaxID=2726742 RepID=A0A7X8XY23_9BACT|nr:MepB family protein [Flammeovirga agarivorans]NLR93814.1 MepB family protein [Flammeovirga agarivorans]